MENIEINLWSIDAGVTWENKNIEVEVTGNLEVFMSCKAITGTGWEFTLTRLTDNTKILEDTGSTGTVQPNYSELQSSINP